MIYLDNHATTRVDPAVVNAIAMFQSVDYANPGSTSHEFGRRLADRIESFRQELAGMLGGSSDELVFTSGATEAINLALLGYCLHRKQLRRRLVSVPTEHRAVLDTLAQLERRGFAIDWLRVYPQGHELCGQIDLEDAAQKINYETALVSTMLANNEIGVLQPIQELSKLCQASGAVLHSDAAQAVGHVEIDINRLGIDLLSFSAHKFHGPLGVGGLLLKDKPRRLRILPQIFGGGQQENRRSGTLNSPGIAGMALALRISLANRETDQARIRQLRDHLWQRLLSALGDRIQLNGPPLQSQLRLDRNLNCRWEGVEGQSLMLECPELCLSSGSACSSAQPMPSHVLQGIGLSQDEARCSIRFGLSRFTTQEEIDTAADQLINAYQKLTA